LVNLTLGIFSGSAKAQGEDKYIQFSGFVIDSKIRVKHYPVHLFNENAGRGSY
jgi:Zn/Cd-binding protein ZinT